MRWLLTSWGSSGDLHPFLALGQELIARGHQVTLVGNPDWERETREAGLRFVSSGEPPLLSALREHPEILSLRWRGLVSIRSLVQYGILPGLDPFYAALKQEAGEHDVLVAHHFVFAAPLVAEQAGMAWATVVLAPGVTPSAYTLPGTNFGPVRSGWLSRWGNRVTWRVGRQLTKPLIDPLINPWRARHGGNPQREVFYVRSPQLNLQLFSGHFYPRPPDWSGENQLGGFCFYDPPGAQLAPEVDRFLSAGEPPILCTLGSTAVQNPGPFYNLVSEALQELGLRGLLLIGDERNRPSHLPNKSLAIPYAPFGLIMPRVRAVVHQGGIGTMAQALRAGKPALVCPYAFDQPNNARRLEALGLGVALPPGKRTRKDFVTGLKKLLAGAAEQQARIFGEKIRAEKGAEQACAVLEKTFGPAAGGSA